MAKEFLAEHWFPVAKGTTDEALVSFAKAKAGAF
jgi:hypothetical protein